MLAQSSLKSSVALLFILSSLATAPLGAGHASTTQTFHIDTITSYDDDGDGFLDNVTVEFNVPMDWTALGGAEDWEVSFFDDEPQTTVADFEPVDATTLALRLDEWSVPYTGAVESVTYVGAAADLAADEGSLDFDPAATPELVDAAAPVPLFAQLDVNDIFGVDAQNFLVLFSEFLDPESLTEDNVTLRFQGGAAVPLVDLETSTEEDELQFMVALPDATILPTQLADLEFVADDSLIDFAGNGADTTPVPVTDLPHVDVSLLPEDGLVRLNETGQNTTVDLPFRLTVPPTSDIVLDVSSANVGEFTVDKAKLTFTPSNYATPQILRLTAYDDHVVESGGIDVATLLRLEANFTAMAPHMPWDYVVLLGNGFELPVVVKDTTKANFTVSAASVSVSESGTSQTIQVALTAKPMNLPPSAPKVVLDLAVSDATEAGLNRTRLTFGAGNWSTPQLVKVTGVDDAELDGSRPLNVTLTVNAALTTDNAFDAIPVRKVPVTVADNDTAGLVLESPRATVAEPTGTGTVKVKLAAKPDFGTSGQVRVKATSSDPKLFTSSPANVTFTAADWNTFKAFTLTAVDDTVPEGTLQATLALAIEPAHTVASYDGVAALSVPVNVTDNDAGFILSASDLTLREGATGTYTVRLSTAPASNVVVGLTAVNGTAVSPAKLTFGSGNWSTPRTVTVTAVDDSALQGDRGAHVTQAIVSGPAPYATLASSKVAVAVQDDDDDAVTTASVAAANKAIVLKVTREGTVNSLSWELSATPPAPVAGVQVWRNTGAGYVLLETLPSSHAAFKAGTYDDRTGPAGAQYRMTAYYGQLESLGYSADGKSSAVSDFATLQSAKPTEVDRGLGVGAWAFLGFVGLAILGLGAFAIHALVRRR